MKRVLILLVVVVIAVAAFVLYPRPGAVTAANAATIAVFRGDVETRHAGADFGPAFDGDILSSGEVVRSQEQGRAVLTFFDDSTVSIEPGSLVKVASLVRTSGGGIQVSIEQTLGRTWTSVAKLKTPDSKFEIKTPALTAAVRGTTFETLVVKTPDGKTITTVKTFEGEVVVQAVSGGQPTGPETTVTAGTQIQVKEDEPIPPAPTPQPPTPRLRFAAAPGVGFTVIDPRGLSCGSTGLLRTIPQCDTSGGVVTIGDVQSGNYRVVLTAAAAVTDAGLVLQGVRGDTRDFTIGFVRALAVGDLVLTSTTVTVGPDGRLSATQFIAAILATSVCGAEATGRVFSSGTIEERRATLRSFAAGNKGQPAAIVLADSELSTAAAQGAASVGGGPATISNVAVTVDNAGLHLSAQVSAGPITVAATGDVIAGASNGKLILRIRSLDVGPIPGMIKDQLVAAIEKQLNDEFSGSFPLVVDRVALRPGCVGVMGTAP